jgi:hypothetical protein
VTGGGGLAACCGVLSPQADKATATKTISGLKARTEWRLEPASGAKRSDLPLMLTLFSPALAAPIRLPAQSVQEPGEIKEIRYASSAPARAAVRTGNFWIAPLIPCCAFGAS